MKKPNIIPIICGCIALLVCIGAVAEFKNNVTNNGLGVAFTVTVLPFAALAACIYFIFRGGNHAN